MHKKIFVKQSKLGVSDSWGGRVVSEPSKRSFYKIKSQTLE